MNCTKFYTENGHEYRITVKIRWDDECKNGHKTFAITGDIDEKLKNGRWGEYAGGCIHNEIEKHFPDLAHMIKWHLMGENEPMHYVANTVYHAREKKFDYARSTAIWPEATDAELSVEPEELKKALLDRLPALIAAFKRDIQSIGMEF